MHRSIRRALVPAVLAVLAVVLTMVVGRAPALADDGATVTVRDGTLRGTVTSDHREFFKIPFAAPPTGSRRFAPPAPAAPWKGVRDARSGSPWCPQAAPFLGDVVPSQEDCLYLDVYTPPAAASKKLPVMVWIYGGAYSLGATGQYHLTQLVTKGDVIGVAVNYRVGPFGFLAAPGLAGNYGLQDQQAGLRWVRQNIAAFGGDPGDVTIFGESAGGNSVCQQLASPTARGLFDKAIVESGACGTSTLDGQSRARAEATGLAYAKGLGCTDTAAPAACLRSKSQHDLLSSPLTQFTSMKVNFRPVVDGRVVTGSTGAAFAAGTQAKVPVLIGGNRDEGRLFVAMFNHLGHFGPVTEDGYRQEVSGLFGADAARILARYPSSAYGSPDLALAAVYTDGLFACSTARAMKDLARTAPAVYGYDFREQDGPLSGIDPLMPLGAHHAAELPYLGLPAFDATLTPADQRLSDRMISDWTTFARTGRPGPGWPRADTGRLLTLQTAGVGTDSQSAVAASHHCGFWASLG